MGALVIDRKRYARVLAKVLPRVITTDEEHERMLAELEKLMDKGERRSAAEDAALDLMVRLVKDYEKENYPLDFQIQRLRVRRRQRKTRHQ
jgi:hypothetical protein